LEEAWKASVTGPDAVISGADDLDKKLFDGYVLGKEKPLGITFFCS
jgi:hypothetical protein